MAQLTVHLVRHGETDWNLEGRIQGSTDIPLNATGREQAAETARALAHLGETSCAVLSSDLSRAQLTADYIAAAAGLALSLEPRLRERGFGALEGSTYAEARSSYGVRWRDVLDAEPPRVSGAETTRQHYARVAAALDAVRADPPAEQIVVVSHGGTVRRALSYARGGFETERWEAIPNASVHTVTLATA